MEELRPLLVLWKEDTLTKWCTGTNENTSISTVLDPCVRFVLRSWHCSSATGRFAGLVLARFLVLGLVHAHPPLPHDRRTKETRGFGSQGGRSGQSNGRRLPPLGCRLEDGSVPPPERRWSLAGYLRRQRVGLCGSQGAHRGGKQVGDSHSSLGAGLHCRVCRRVERAGCGLWH